MPQILMVEDETDILDANTAWFSAQGYEVKAVRTLAAARTTIEDSMPDIVLLDVMLPDGSGFDFCCWLREKSDVPIIYLTALSDVADEERGFALGGDDYVVKPYHMNVLAARIAAHLRRAGQPASGKLEIPPLEVDLLAGSCQLNGQPIKLSQMERRMLYYFMENLGKRINRDVIYEHVWGSSADYASHTVKEHVYRLRKKLDMADPDSWFMITADGADYLFSKVRY